MDGLGNRRHGRVGGKEEDEVDWEKWKILSCCGNPEKGEAERRRIDVEILGAFHRTYKV